MRWLSEAIERVRTVVFRAAEERELDEELRFHLELETEKHVRAGLSRREAERRARHTLGGVERTKEAVRDARGTRGVEELLLDVRQAVRRMRRSPGVTAAIVATFALGLGATATMFGVLDRLLLEPPAHVDDPQGVKRLVNERFLPWMGEHYTSEHTSFVAYERLHDVAAFEEVAGWARRELVVGRGRGAEEVGAVLVTHEFFPLLGVRPVLGRLFDEAEDRRGAPGTVVLGHGFWERRYGGDPDILGRSLELGAGSYTIIGVTPPGFTGVGLAPVDVWLPLQPAGAALNPDPRWFTDPGWNWVRLIARMAPGATTAVAEASATAVYRRSHPDEDPDARVMVAPLLAARGPLASAESDVATWLFGVTVLVLLIVSANVANIQLARSLRRRRETGMRLALGGSRRRLVQSAVVEALLLSLLGAVAALAVAQWGGALVRAALVPEAAAGWTGSGRVLAFVAGAAVLSAGFAALIPAVQSTRVDVMTTLGGGGRGIAGGMGGSRKALAVIQTALSVLLLVGAGLFLRSLWQVTTLDLGLATDRVMVAAPLFDDATTETARKASLERVTERLRGRPELRGAVRVQGSVPFVRSQSVGLYLPGQDSVPIPPGGGPYVSAVDPDYFETLGIDIVEGRGLDPRDRPGTEPVVVVGRTLASWLAPGGGALGRCVQLLSDDSPCRTIVGIAEDTHRHRLVEEPAAQAYLPLAQSPLEGAPDAILVRARHDAVAPASVVRATILEAGDVRFAGVRTLDELLDPQSRSWRTGAVLFTLFGLLALAVSAIGVYAVLAFAVAQRRAELGVRAALGATRDRLARLVLGQSLRLVATGIAAGLGLALLAGPSIEPLLFQTRGRDPVTLAAVAVVLLLVGTAAAVVPAVRAMTVDPGRTLTE